MMDKPDNKVPYRQPGKRNPVKDVLTDAGRRAMNRAAEKEAEISLRTSLENPTDAKGKPVAGHVVKKIAAERLLTLAGSNLDFDFHFAAGAFVSKLKYQWGCATSVSDLWKTFLELIQAAELDQAVEFAKRYASAFRWVVAGHVHRLALQYQERPNAIVTIEVWQKKKQIFHVGVQRDGKRRMIPLDRSPEHPTIVFAGSKIHQFIALKDFIRIMGRGNKRIEAALKSGISKFSFPPEALVDEDIALNVSPPKDEDLAKIRRMFSALF
jgi:hypothetical protein